MKNKFISCIDFAKKVADVAYLYKRSWKENTTALLHAPREIDKARVAFDIADNLSAQGREVLYVNTERNAAGHASKMKSPEKIFIFTPCFESADDTTDYADIVINGLEEAIAETNIRTFIIDSVTRIAALSFGRNASPAYVMKRLVALQVRCNVSLLVIAHSSTAAVNKALNNLADSDIDLSLTSTEETENQASISVAEPETASEVEKKPREERVNDRPADYSMFHWDSPGWNRRAYFRLDPPTGRITLD